MKRNFNLILVSLVGLILLALYLCSRWSEKIHDNENVIMEVDEAVVSQQIRKVVQGYRKQKVVIPMIPEETPTDDGFLVVEGTDSVEFCTDLFSGHPYRIIIENARQAPLCKLLNEAGDSIEWDYAAQVIRFSNDSLCTARLMVADNVFPFGISENIDSIPETRFCDISLAELINSAQDSIHSGATRFPVLGSATILFCTASQQSDKLYLKVVHPGLLSVAVVYDESVCGYPLFWDNESDIFGDGVQELLGASTYDSLPDTLLEDFWILKSILLDS